MSNGPDWPIAFCPIPFSKDAKSVHLWEGVFLYCWGKTLLHTKPSPSPSLSIFPSSLLAAVFLSELGSGAKLFFFPFFFRPPIILASQPGTRRLTDTQKRMLSFSASALSHTHLFTVHWPHFGLQTEEQVFPPCYLATVRVHVALREEYSEKCFHGKVPHGPFLFTDLLLPPFHSVTSSWVSHLSVGKTVAEHIPCWLQSLFLSPFLTVRYSILRVSVPGKNLKIKQMERELNPLETKALKQNARMCFQKKFFFDLVVIFLFWDFWWKRVASWFSHFHLT